MCAVCNDAINDGEQAIECHRCKHWSHKQCTDLNEAEFRVLQRGCENLLWQCSRCVKEGAPINRTEAQLDMIVTLFQDMLKRLEKLEGAYTGKSLDLRIEEAVDKKMTQIVEETGEKEIKCDNSQPTGKCGGYS